MQEVASRNRPDLTFVLEGAHNPSGMKAACDELVQQAQWNRPWALLLGTSPQTNMRGMLEPLANMCARHAPSAVVLTEPQFGRYPGVDVATLRSDVETLGFPVTVAFPMPDEAVHWLESNAHDCERVLCIGSLYLQGNVLSALGADTDDLLAITAKRLS